MTQITTRAKLALVALVALAVLLVVQQASHGADAAAGPSEPPASFAPSPGSSADPGAVFSALNRSARPADHDNAAIVDFGKHEPWVKVAGARRLAKTAAGTVWLTPTTDGRVCLSLRTDAYTAHTCDTIERARTIGIVLETAGRYIGIVPDGTSRAALVQGDGTTEELALSSGVFDTSARPGTLLVDGKAGSYRLRVV